MTHHGTHALPVVIPQPPAPSALADALSHLGSPPAYIPTHRPAPTLLPVRPVERTRTMRLAAAFDYWTSSETPAERVSLLVGLVAFVAAAIWAVA